MKPDMAAAQLAEIYGQSLVEPLTYPTGVALAGRMRFLGECKADRPLPDGLLALTDQLLSSPKALNEAAPCLATGCFAGDLHRATGDIRCAAYAENLAHRFRADPDVRVEDFFFAGLLLGQAYDLTGEMKHADALMDLLLAADTQQDNGLYWHCHASPWYWGRGNAFAALGVSEALMTVPEHPRRDALLSSHRRHLAATSAMQHRSGLWHQLIDDEASYLEFSATAMFGCAIARGIRGGWLSENQWPSVLERAWQGIAERIGSDGELSQVCVGTGPLSSREAYFDRPFSEGRDDRGGAMALLFAVEMMRYEDA